MEKNNSGKSNSFLGILNLKKGKIIMKITKTLKAENKIGGI